MPSLEAARAEVKRRGEYYRTLGVEALYHWVIYDELKTVVIERG